MEGRGLSSTKIRRGELGIGCECLSWNHVSVDLTYGREVGRERVALLPFLLLVDKTGWLRLAG